MHEYFPATAKAAPGSSTQPLISICIPTYNFGAFISETLESLEQQDLSGAEIVVLDSASTDNTQEVVASFACRLPNLRYIRTDKKLGIDRDMARVAAEAHGQFIWLFSADDVMRPDALALVKPYLKEEYDVLLCPTTAPAGIAVEMSGNPKNIGRETFSFYQNCCVTDLTGHPSISVPAGMIDGLPVGAMLTAKHFDEMTLLRAAKMFIDSTRETNT